MPYKEKEPERIFFTIGEVAKKFKVNTSLIRFWEKEFDILNPKKNKKETACSQSRTWKTLKLFFTL